MTADLRRLVKKSWRCSKYPSLYARQRNYKKNIKTECLRREGYISPMCSAYPLTPSYPVVHVSSYGRHNHSCTISAQFVQGLGSYGNPNFLYIATMTITTVRTTVLYSDTFFSTIILVFSLPKHLCEIPMGDSWGYMNFVTFCQIFRVAAATKGVTDVCSL